jgi:hypothetical protein
MVAFAAKRSDSLCADRQANSPNQAGRDHRSQGFGVALIEGNPRGDLSLEKLRPNRSLRVRYLAWLQREWMLKEESEHFPRSVRPPPICIGAGGTAA